jgi:hypothetical protein
LSQFAEKTVVNSPIAIGLKIALKQVLNLLAATKQTQTAALGTFKQLLTLHNPKKQ